MTTTDLANYRLFDYEKSLSSREVASLMGAAERRNLPSSISLIRDRATYLRAVEHHPTAQALTESLHHELRGSKSRRQATRYLVHGLHEYKGKFNPQMARALINVVDPAANVLIDPFCGSGTTLIEGLRMNMSGVGFDQNPLAVWVARTKLDLMRSGGESGLVEDFEHLSAKVLTAMESAQRTPSIRQSHWITRDSLTYLQKWFPPGVLCALLDALTICKNEVGPSARALELAISNIVRDVSWQLPEDLRVRRRPITWEPPSVAEVLRSRLVQVRTAMAELERHVSLATDVQTTVVSGSSRVPALLKANCPPGHKVVVTSPPYATALPYVDTDRLSIVLLGLSQPSELSPIERDLTGSREWRVSEARKWAAALHENVNDLPTEITTLLEAISRTNNEAKVGFRKAALPSLLYRYFSQIGETLLSLHGVLSQGERVVMVIGTNRTGKGESQLIIKTPELIGSMAGQFGFSYDESISLETWARYGMHSKNAVSSEEAVVLTRE